MKVSFARWKLSPSVSGARLEGEGNVAEIRSAIYFLETGKPRSILPFFFNACRKGLRRLSFDLNSEETVRRTAGAFPSAGSIDRVIRRLQSRGRTHVVTPRPGYVVTNRPSSI